MSEASALARTIAETIETNLPEHVYLTMITTADGPVLRELAFSSNLERAGLVTLLEVFLAGLKGGSVIETPRDDEEEDGDAPGEFTHH